MANSKIIKQEVIQTHEDADGNITSSTVTTTTNIKKNDEPDYIKIYTKMWCEFKSVPAKWHQLFLELATRMSYADANDTVNSQTVVVYGGISEAICEACHWKDKSTLRKGLKALCDFGAIKRTKYRATYQINPNYAGRGLWKYDPKRQNGGIEDLVAIFNFKDGTVDTKVVWADDGTDSEINKTYREGMEVSKQNETVLKTMTYTKDTVDEFPNNDNNNNTDRAVV